MCGGSHGGWHGFEFEAFSGVYIAEERFDSSGVGMDSAFCLSLRWRRWHLCW